MAGEIEKFDPSKLVDQVRERIRNTFAELIPEEEWKRLIQREVTFFLQAAVTRKNSYGRDYVERGAIGMLVDDELTAMLKEMIKKELEGPDWSAWFDGQKMHIGPQLKETLEAAAPAMFAQIISTVMRDLASNVR